jgi:hypothetical protein
MRWPRNTPPPSPSKILVGLIADDILRHAHEWANLHQPAKLSKDYRVIRRKGYTLMFVEYDAYKDGRVTVHPQSITKGFTIEKEDAEFLGAVLTQAKRLYQAPLDAAKVIEDGLKANQTEADRQMAACDAIERFMTYA